MILRVLESLRDVTKREALIGWLNGERYTVACKSIRSPLKLHNFFQINPNDLSFFEMLEGLVYLIM